MPESVQCDLCEMLIPPHAHFVLRMDLFADPSMPQISGEELAEMDFDETFRKLIEQMKDMTSQELSDLVHRRMEFRLCPQCQREFLSNPLGKPRKTGRRPASN